MFSCTLILPRSFQCGLDPYSAHDEKDLSSCAPYGSKPLVNRGGVKLL